MNPIGTEASSTTAGPVVVGVDASVCARDAAGWAADISAAWSAPLHLVHVVPAGSPTAEVPSWLGDLSDGAQRAGVAVSSPEVLSGSAIDVLAERSAGARLLVIGSYGEGATSGMLAGSLALGLLGRSACPVAVVRGPERDTPPPRSGPIVVGVDGSPAARAALDIAAGLAAVLGTRLVVVRTWSEVVSGPHGAARRPEATARVAADAGAGLDADLASVSASHPGLEVEPVVVQDTRSGLCSTAPAPHGCWLSATGMTTRVRPAGPACSPAPPVVHSRSSLPARSW